MIAVLSLGGSLIAPDKVDAPFVKRFSALIGELLAEGPARRFIIVTGGGAPARLWQSAYR
jgi:uridylate kinase